jgi:lipid A disaccharide synthetase
MEPTTGIEPVDLFLTKEALYRLSYVGHRMVDAWQVNSCKKTKADAFELERETRFELATSSLEG